MSDIVKMFKFAKNPKQHIQNLKDEKAAYDARKKEESEQKIAIPVQETYTVKLINGLGKEYFINFPNDYDTASEVYKLINSGKFVITLEKNIEKVYVENSIIHSKTKIETKQNQNLQNSKIDNNCDDTLANAAH